MATTPEIKAPADEQTACDRCAGALQPGATYCDRCGTRTRRAKRNVRLVLRIELLVLLMIVIMVFGFTAVFYSQGR